MFHQNVGKLFRHSGTRCRSERRRGGGAVKSRVVSEGCVASRAFSRFAPHDLAPQAISDGILPHLRTADEEIRTDNRAHHRHPVGRVGSGNSTTDRLPDESEASAKCADLCRKTGTSEGTFCDCKARVGGMTVSEAKGLRRLRQKGSLTRRWSAKLNERLAAQMSGVAAVQGFGRESGSARREARGCCAFDLAVPGCQNRKHQANGPGDSWKPARRAMRPTRRCAGSCGI